MIKRKFLGLLICIILVMVSSITAFADTNDVVEVEYFDDGSYMEIIIEENNPGISLLATTSTKTGSKSAQYKNSSGTIMWYVKVTGTFSYNGSTSSCTKSVVTASAPASAWSIKDKDASRSGSTAKATATAVKKVNKITTNSMTKTVSLKCSKSGALS